MIRLPNVGHLTALFLLWLLFGLVGCGIVPKSWEPKVPTAEYVAGLTIQTVAYGALYADAMCEQKAKAIYLDAKAKDDDAGKERAISLAVGCDKNYDAARKALLAAAVAVDGWKDAANQGKAVCALSEATTSLTLIVQALKDAGVGDLPKEITLALGAVAVLADMVEAKSCPMPVKGGAI